MKKIFRPRCQRQRQPPSADGSQNCCDIFRKWAKRFRLEHFSFRFWKPTTNLLQKSPCRYLRNKKKNRKYNHLFCVWGKQTAVYWDEGLLFYFFLYFSKINAVSRVATIETTVGNHVCSANGKSSVFIP